MVDINNARNEDALDFWADILEPVAEILADKNIKDLFSGKPIKLAAYIIKHHKREVLQILARVDGVPVDEYSCNVFTLPAKIIALINDPQFQELFTSQAQKSE